MGGNSMLRQHYPMATAKTLTPHHIIWLPFHTMGGRGDFCHSSLSKSVLKWANTATNTLNWTITDTYTFMCQENKEICFIKKNEMTYK